jgi:small subunit ribosomal protein S8
MSMQDPISDMLTRVRNGQAVAKKEVAMPLSKQKLAIANILKSEGFVSDVLEATNDKSGHPELVVVLKYHNEKPVITKLTRYSRPALRVYKGKDDLPKVKNGLGVAIISTNQGVMSDREARKRGLGGEILCFVE